jgi:hypothetical protein
MKTWTQTLVVAVGFTAVASACATRIEPAQAAPIPPSQQAVDVGGPPSAPQPTASSLESRVQEYWVRRQAKDLAGAYPYYCSAYRSRVSQGQFLQMTRLVRFDIQDVRVTGVTSSGDRAEATIAYKFLMPTLLNQLLDGRTTDVWARDADGKWCKEDEPLVLPFPPPAPGAR